MKTYHIKDLLKKDLLIIELPENVKIYHDEDDEGNHIGYSLTEFGEDSIKSLGLIDGYTLLGKPDEISEDHAKELVNLHESGYYKDYINVNNFFTLPSKSLLSLLESEVYWKNPYDKSGMTFANEYENKWQEAEKKTFDRNRSIILVKN